jgi:hypothetical protein
MLALIIFSAPWFHEKAAQKALRILQFAYPIVLLFFFIFAFTARSVWAATSDNANDEQPPMIQYGPGGKPLPIRANSYRRVVPRDFSRSRKLVFEWLSAGMCLTWMGNAAVVIVHSLYNRKEQWWCGQAPTVSELEYCSVLGFVANGKGLHRWLLLRVLTPPHLPRRHYAVSHNRTASHMGSGSIFRGRHLLAGFGCEKGGCQY